MMGLGTRHVLGVLHMGMHTISIAELGLGATHSLLWDFAYSEDRT